MNLILPLTLTTASLTAFFYFIVDHFYTGKKKTKQFKTKSVKEIVNLRVKKAVANRPKAKKLLTSIEKMLRTSTVRVKNEPMPLSVFLFVSLLFGFTGLVVGAVMLNNIPVGLIALIVMTSIPYNLLSFDFLRNKKAVRKSTTNFLLVMSNLIGIYDDPIIAFREAGKNFKNPLVKRELNWFISAIEAGFPLEDIIREVKSRLPDQIMKDFFDDVHFYMEHGGDLQENIITLVKKTYNREMNQSQKDTEANSVLLIVGILTIFYFGILFFFSTSQADLMNFWVESTIGKGGAFVMASIFLLVGYIVRGVVLDDGEGG